MEAVGTKIHRCKGFMGEIAHVNKPGNVYRMKNRKLIIMRHAKSDWTTNAGRDFDRPLSKRGNNDAPKMGNWLKKQDLIPDKVLSSPAQRTKQTAYLVAAELGLSEEDIIWDSTIYEASLSDLLTVLDNHTGEADILLLIGHNPSVDSLLEYLSSDVPEENDDGKLMTTAAVAVLDYGEGPIVTEPGSGQLSILIRPREIK